MRLSQETLAVLVTALLVGCTPPYPTHKRTTGPAGAIAKLPDPSAVKPGDTTRDDVLRAFKEVDTGVSSQWFFWGRWKGSSFALRAVTDSGIEEIPIWSATNLLVEFDERGTAKRSETLSDKRVVQELQRILAEHLRSLPLTESISTGADLYPPSRHSCYCGIKLSSTVVEFSPRKPGGISFGKCPSGVSVPVQELAVASFTPPFGEFDPGPIDRIRITFRFSKKTAFGTEIPASLKVNDLVSLLGFVEASRSPER